MLGEMPSIKDFDIAVLLNMDRIVPGDAQPFIFSDTIATEISDRSRRKVQSIEALRMERPDLTWFTDLCAPRASGRAYTINYHPMKRNLWIIDVNPRAF
jgi:hypothetical protein